MRLLQRQVKTIQYKTKAVFIKPLNNIKDFVIAVYKEFAQCGKRDFVPAFTLAEFFTPHPTSHRKAAFTLAEVLVTLGIIGVVSAMTVPSLMQNYQRQSYVTQLHKVYNIINQALLQYKTDRNALNLKEAGLNSQDAVNTFFTSYFKVIQSCLDVDVTPCFSNDYKKITGDKFDAFGTANGSYIIADGATLRPYFHNPNNAGIVWLIDINAQKGPNIVGRDLFAFCSDNNGNLDECGVYSLEFSVSREKREEYFASHCISSLNSSSGYFGKILNDNWQMTY